MNPQMPLDGQLISCYLQEATRALNRVQARERRRIKARYQNGWSARVLYLKRRIEFLRRALLLVLEEEDAND